MKNDIVIVVPNHLPHLNFLNEWEEFKQYKIIVVQDNNMVPIHPEDFDIEIVNHRDIQRDLGINSWIIPNQTSACRSYGYYKAYLNNPKYILTIDNDCYPESKQPYLIEGHVRNLESSATLDWVNSPVSNNIPTRGFPYYIRDNSEVVLSHGVWSNVPDFDGIDMLKTPNQRFKSEYSSKIIPRWNFYPMCGMNLAWKTEYTPLLYFGLFGPNWGFDQYDDIWAGVFSKKIIDHLGKAVISGSPSVEHRKQSNPFINLEKQAPALEVNETLWLKVQEVKLESKTIISSYRELINKVQFTEFRNGYFNKLVEATNKWLDLYEIWRPF